MSRRGVAVVSLGILFAIPALLTPLVVAAPPEPHNFYGMARESDGTTPIAFGTRITAFIDGVDYSNGTAVDDAGGHYDVDVAGNWVTQTGQPNTPEVKEGGDVGDPVMFVAGDMTTSGQVFTAQRPWGVPSPGTVERLDLTLAASQPALVKVARIATRPADGLPPYLYVCNPTPSPVDLSAYLLQKDAAAGFSGPRHLLSGALPRVVPAGGLSYVNLTSWDLAGTTLAPNGDSLKLVWDNAGGTGFGGSDVVIDRVEYNGTSGGTIYQIGEPTNTVMSDAPAPSSGQEIRRSAACGDTNSNAVDFTVASETGRPGPPSVSLTAPDGGQVWAGRTPHDVAWMMTDADTPGNLIVDLAYSVDGGASYPNPIATGLSRPQGPNRYTWTTPCMNSTTVRVRAVVSDGLQSTWDASAADFTLECGIPAVSGVVPADGSVDVRLFQPLEITFSEPMSRVATQSAVAVVPPITGVVYTWSAAWDILTVSHNDFTLCTAYTVTVGTGARDVSSNPLPSPFAWSFATVCPPTVTVSAPVGGEVWSGGSTHNIAFTTTDVDTTLSVSVEVFDGRVWWRQYGPTPLPAGPQIVPVTLPGVDTTAACVRVYATDSTSLTGLGTSGGFTIDARAPSVLRSVPAAGATAADLTADFTVTFSEAMDLAATNLSVSLSPSAGDLVLLWNPAGTSLAVRHGPLARGRSYTLAVSTTAKDRSDPGNPLSPAYRVTFTATSVSPLSADAGPDRTGPVGDSLSFDGSGSAPGDLITGYRWELTDPDGGSTVLQGRTASFTFTKAGVWHVVLNVTDGEGNFDTDEALVTISERQGQDLLGAYGWLLGVLAVAIAAVVLFLVLRRRRRGEEPSPAPALREAVAEPREGQEGAVPAEEVARELEARHGVAGDPRVGALEKAFVSGRIGADLFEENLRRLRKGS